MYVKIKHYLRFTRNEDIKAIFNGKILMLCLSASVFTKIPIIIIIISFAFNEITIYNV